MPDCPRCGAEIKRLRYECKVWEYADYVLDVFGGGEWFGWEYYGSADARPLWYCPECDKPLFRTEGAAIEFLARKSATVDCDTLGRKLRSPVLEVPMPEVKLRKGSLGEAVRAFVEWDNDPGAKAAYSLLVEEAESSAAGMMSQLCFWDGRLVREDPPSGRGDRRGRLGSKRPERPIAPTFV